MKEQFMSCTQQCFSNNHNNRQWWNVICYQSN